MQVNTGNVRQSSTTNQEHVCILNKRLRQLRLLTTRGRQSTLLLGLLNLLHNRILQRLRLRQTRPPPNNLAVRRDQELLKVPLDTLQAQHAGLLLLHPGPHGGRAVAVDVQLAQHGEGDAVVDLAEGLDVVVGAGVLAAELVAGEADDEEIVGVFALELLVEVLEALELGREAAFGGGVDDEHDLAFEAGEGVGGALLCWEMWSEMIFCIIFYMKGEVAKGIVRG